MKLTAIVSALESFAPPALQEDYDNSGLLVGNFDLDIRKIMISLDITEDIVQEAIQEGCNLLVSHHPFIFKGFRSVTGKDIQERILLSAIKNEIAIYAMHTNLDNVYEGVNSMLARQIGLHNLRILAPMQGNLRKLVTFCPASHADQVRNAMFEAGAGHIGNYASCSYNIEGQGTFRAGEGADPFVGSVGKLHFEKEIRIETIYPVHLERQILSAMQEKHPYEEVAYDIYPLSNINQRTGAGMTGELKSGIDEKEFLELLKGKLRTSIIRHSGLTGRMIKKVAICGGSGSFLIKQAIGAGSDAFVTGDIKYHQFFDAEDKILIADVGHYESEQFTKDLIFQILKEKFPKFALQISKVNTNPVNYFY